MLLVDPPLASSPLPVVDVKELERRIFSLSLKLAARKRFPELAQVPLTLPAVFGLVGDDLALLRMCDCTVPASPSRPLVSPRSTWRGSIAMAWRLWREVEVDDEVEYVYPW